MTTEQPHPEIALLLRLLDECLRVLRPGGVAIFETPNPNNMLVGSCNFYVDPTHRNPVHPRTLHYLFGIRGMLRVEQRLRDQRIERFGPIVMLEPIALAEELADLLGVRLHPLVELFRRPVRGVECQVG